MGRVGVIARASTVAFVMALLVWPAYALDWVPGGLPATVVVFGLCLAGSYLCYRVLRVRHDAEQVAQLRAMQEREGLSDEELLRHVALHHPNLGQFGKSLAAKVDAGKQENLRCVRLSLVGATAALADGCGP